MTMHHELCDGASRVMWPCITCYVAVHHVLCGRASCVIWLCIMCYITFENYMCKDIWGSHITELQSLGMWCHIVRYIGTNDLAECNSPNTSRLCLHEILYWPTRPECHSAGDHNVCIAVFCTWKNMKYKPRWQLQQMLLIVVLQANLTTTHDSLLSDPSQFTIYSHTTIWSLIFESEKKCH